MATGLVTLHYAPGVVPPEGEPLIFDVEMGPQPGTGLGMTFAAFKDEAGNWALWVPAPEGDLGDSNVWSGVFWSRSTFEKWAREFGYPTVYLGPATTPSEELIPELEAARAQFLSKPKSGNLQLALFGGAIALGLGVISITSHALESSLDGI
ncbi:MAG: hypothetical protein ABIH46_14160 [Chloroflexota bacterium]